jgi:hypothetical protein
MAALHPEDYAASPMKTTEELKALRDSITRGMWSTDTIMYNNFPVHTVRAPFYTDAVHYRKPRAGHTKAERIQHNADSQAIALIPDLLSEVIKLREALGTLRNGLFKDARSVNEFIDATLNTPEHG